MRSDHMRGSPPCVSVEPGMAEWPAGSCRLGGFLGRSMSADLVEGKRLSKASLPCCGAVCVALFPLPALLANRSSCGFVLCWGVAQQAD